MCGIVGIASVSHISTADKAAVSAAMQRMQRRGPDGSGLWAASETVVFGHTRLAILDPASGQQPWCESEHGLVLVFNGEIYNFEELRAQLESSGHIFRTHCDTEVLAKAYIQWGWDCLQRLNGMFAFALFDRAKNSVWLVRDRLGIKPLYYCLSARSLVFASVPHVLLDFDGVSRRMDPVAVRHYLQTVRTNLNDRTLFADVKILPPGHELRLDLDSWHSAVRPWWQLPGLEVGTECPVTDWEGSVQFVRATVEDAVRIQLLSDVPLGGFLSGGLDSSILTSAATRQLPKDQFAVYSVGYAEAEGTTEWEYMRIAREHYNVEGKEVLLEGSDFWDDWVHLIEEKGLPLSTPNEVPIMRMAQVFKQQFTVALTGEGADEVFGGYAGPSFCGFDYDRLRTAPRAVSLNALLRGYGRASFADPLDLFFQVNSWIGRDRLNQILKSESVVTDQGLHPEIAAFYRQLLAGSTLSSTVDTFMRIHLRVNLEGLLLRMDSSTMAASVEGRVPFTDHRLVEYLYQLPCALRMALKEAWQAPGAHYPFNALELIEKGAVDTKILLRKAFAHQVPESILQRPKMSFPVPFQQWIQGPLATPVAELLESSDWMQELFKPGFLHSCGKPGGPTALELWPLTNLALWAKAFDLE